MYKATSKLRGKDIYYCEEENIWKYASDNEATNKQNDIDRGCGHCNQSFTEEDHDPCIRNLKGVMNACCGHGIVEDCYIQLLDGECIRGKDAKVMIDVLKKYS